MPYVNVKITRGGVTVAQKKRIVEDITRTLVATLGKKPEHIHIVIDEVDPENWGFAGMLTTEFLAQKPSSKSAAIATRRKPRGSKKLLRQLSAVRSLGAHLSQRGRSN